MAAKFSTIHVFGFGTTQIIRSDSNKSIESSSLTTLSTLVDHITSLKPADVTLLDYHAIHIFRENQVKYLGRNDGSTQEKTHFSINWADLDSTIVDAFVDELIALVDA